MRNDTRIAHVIIAVILTMCTTGSVMAEKGGIRGEVTALQESFAELNSQVQIIQLNQDVNIVRFAAYVANDEFDEYIIALTRVSQGCQVFVADERVFSAVTSAFAADILMDPQELLDLAGVNEFFNQPAMIPLNVECFSGEKGHVTGMLFRDQALPR